MFEKINQLLNPCVNWSIENKRCKLTYEPHHPLVSFKTDIDKNCRGYSNPQKCVWYQYERLTDAKIKKLRDKLRSNRP